MPARGSHAAHASHSMALSQVRASRLEPAGLQKTGNEVTNNKVVSSPRCKCFFSGVAIFIRIAIDSRGAMKPGNTTRVRTFVRACVHVRHTYTCASLHMSYTRTHEIPVQKALRQADPVAPHADATHNPAVRPGRCLHARRIQGLCSALSCACSIHESIPTG